MSNVLETQQTGNLLECMSFQYENQSVCSVAISFAIVNSSNQGDFYKGIPPIKYVPDDFTHDWSDRNESCLKEAIYYLEHGSTSPKGTYIYQPSIQFSEKPYRMNNVSSKNK